MPTREEKSTFRHSEGVYASLFVAGNNKKSNYGQLLHNIGWSQADDYGIFFLDDGTVKAYKIREVDAATDRLVHGAFETSTYKQGLDYGKYLIKTLRQNLFAGPGGGDKDQTNRVLKELMDETLQVFRAGQPPPKPKKPTPIVKLHRNKKPKIASPTGTAAVYPELRKETACGWCEGRIVKFNKANEYPYVLTWDTNPPLQIDVKEADILGLVQNYKFCKESLIFNGVVGRTLLWPCLPVGVNRDSKMDYLKIVKVMFYNPAGSVYALSFRNGNLFYLSPVDVDKATDRDEDIRALEPVQTDFNMKNVPLVRFKQVDINLASVERGNYKRGSQENVDETEVSSSESDGLSDSDDKLKKVRGTLANPDAVTRLNLAAEEAKMNKSKKLVRPTTRKGTRSETHLTFIKPKVKPIFINPYH